MAQITVTTFIVGLDGDGITRIIPGLIKGPSRP